MNTKKTIKNIFRVSISNLTTIISGVVVGLLLPRIISVSDYGWYKTFTLYTTYIGLCSLGVIDGIVLEYGGNDYGQLERKKFRSFFSWYAIINAFFAIGLISSALFIHDSNAKFIVVMIGLYLVISNITGYFQQISQFTQRFKEFSLRKILNSALRIFVVVLLIALGKIGITPEYKLYIVIFVLCEAVLTVWYLWTYREIVFGDRIPLKDTYRDIFHLSLIGFPLLFSNLCSTLILTLDRQFVSILFDTETYAVYAFAYNMLSLVTVAVSAISTVLYPTLKRASSETIEKLYDKLVGIITAVVFMALFVYFPLSSFVDWFLPKYHDSLIIFRIIFPGLAISSSITIVMHNYYKVIGKNLAYFIRSIIALMISGIANYIAYSVWGTTISISIASILTMLVWYAIVESYFILNYNVKWKKNAAYMIIMTSFFYVITTINSMIISGGCYLLFSALITYCFYRKEIKKKI